MTSQKFNILYGRLSQEDARMGDSNSIINQRLLLEKYAKDNGFENTIFLADDGYSGTNFDRPSWKQIEEMIERGEVETLIVKDLSRLGREYLQVGYYTELYFPRMGVRFIAVNDGVDSLIESSNDFSPIRNWANELHAKDSSKKVRAVKKLQAERGERLGGKPPYGYKKVDKDSKAIIPDEEAAGIVKRIFAMCAAGKGPNQIARILSNEKIYNPTNYYYHAFGKSHNQLDTTHPYHWTGSTVTAILENMVYLGHTVGLRHTTISYKNKKAITRPDNEVIIVENTHPALITREQWDIVQDLRKQKKRAPKQMEEPNIFSGITFCADCGRSMVLHRASTMKKSSYNFKCYTYGKRGKAECSPHHIREDELYFWGFNEARRVTYFDSLHVYKRPAGELKDARVMSWKALGVPVRKDTIMPTATEKGKVSLKKSGNDWIFESVTASGKKLTFTVKPATGTLGDITVDYNNKTFKPMDGGGFYWALDNVYPVKPESLLAPNSPRVKAALKSIKANGSKLDLQWVYTIDGKHKYNAAWQLEVKDNTLIAELTSAEGAVGEFKFGAITGISGKVVEFPYLNLGRWIHKSNSPGIFAGDNVYVSSFVDWYNSDASGLFGESSSTPGGHFVLNPVTADHRWVADPNAGDPTNVVRNVSIINGGSYYWPKTDGKRNPARERIMVTVNDNIAAVLPNIPNPKREYLKDTAEAVWATRMWYCNLPRMNYFEEEFAQWQEAYDYGMKNLFVRLHGNINRMYHPRRDGGPSTFIKSFVEPKIGGDEKMSEFFARMRKLDYRIGIYTDHMLLNPIARDAWDLDKLNLDSNGNWLYSSGNCKQTKMSRMVDLQKKFNALYVKKFQPTCAYLDQITCPPCWRYTDYDARTPDAAKFSASYRVMVESLRAEEADFGPVLSEGKTQMFFAGLCDSYAQPQRMRMNVIPDFNLRKLHTMSNDCGFELGWINYKGAAGGEPQKWSYKLLAYQYAYGNTSHIFGNYHGAPLNPLPDFFIRSYFLIQPAQKYYALTPVKAIYYNVNGKLGTIEDAIKAGTLDRNQVKIVYENGLEVAANLNDTENFAVTLHGKKYLLPPEGFAVYLPGKIEAYSALQNNKRVDFMCEGNLVYCAGNPANADLNAQYDYTLRKLGKALELTPAPFKKAETAAVTVPFSGKAKVVALDRKGKSISVGEIAVKNGKVELPVDGKAFRYMISQK